MLQRNIADHEPVQRRHRLMIGGQSCPSWSSSCGGWTGLGIADGGAVGAISGAGEGAAGGDWDSDSGAGGAGADWVSGAGEGATGTDWISGAGEGAGGSSGSSVGMASTAGGTGLGAGAGAEPAGAEVAGGTTFCSDPTGPRGTIGAGSRRCWLGVASVGWMLQGTSISRAARGPMVSEVS